MKVSGFTFIKDAITYDYPVVESISSILPLVDEMIIAVGKSGDETLSLIRSINSTKIRVIETVWNESLREGGRVLALETDKAYSAVSEDSDWAFYIQADEVVHEKYYSAIRSAMEKYKDDTTVDGLLFDYVHFYGSFDYVGASGMWYNKEIRIVRKRKDIFSYRDAQGFRKGNNEKLAVKQIHASIYHYGWVKPPAAMQRKQENFHKYWHNDSWIDENVAKASEFSYVEHMQELKKFTGSHPEVMRDRISQKNWKFDIDISMKKRSFKDTLKAFLRIFGIDSTYRNYILKKNK